MNDSCDTFLLMQTHSHLSDFNKWNKLKKSIHMRQSFPRCKPREVWWCMIGKNIGTEQGCKDNSFSRPVLVVKTWGENFWGLPITSATPENKKESPFYFDLNGIPKLKGFVTLTQIRTFDNRRLIRKIIRLESQKMDLIVSRINSFLL